MDITKHFIELRGIGIVDVKTLFGVSSVKDTQSIDLVIRLEDWNKDKEYDSPIFSSFLHGLHILGQSGLGHFQHQGYADGTFGYSG